LWLGEAKGIFLTEVLRPCSLSESSAGVISSMEHLTALFSKGVSNRNEEHDDIRSEHGAE
jgi:hypothetical protein